MMFRCKWLLANRRAVLLIVIILCIAGCRLPYEFGRELGEAIFTPTPGDLQATPTFTSEAYTGVNVTDPPLTGTVLPEGSSYPPAVVTDQPGNPPTPTEPYPGGSAGEQPGFGQPTGDPSLPPQTEAPVELQAQPITTTPTLTPFLTATPTSTPTATPTFTPLPPPPWMAAPLKETDPRSVKLASGSVQLVEFFAYWSGSSQAMAPIVQGVEAEYGSRVNFSYLDIDNPASHPLMETLGFESEPHFFVLAPDGKVVKELIGPVTLAELRGAIEAALGG